MDTVHWPQMKPMEEIAVQNPKNTCPKPTSSLERKPRPPKESAVNCPRCNSINTKFCYYNNYSLSQPRYFCKTCRRYWTEGGSLRNVPVGGGSRKNKRSSSSNSISSHSSAMSKKLPDLVVPPAPPTLLSQNHSRMMHHEHGHDLNLGFPPSDDFKTISELIQVPGFDGSTKNTNSGGSVQLSALELLTGITTRGVMNSFMPIPIPDPNSAYSSSSGELNMIPSLNFSLDGMGGSSGIHESSSGRLLFPFEELKTSTIATTTTATHDDGHHNVEQHRDQNGDTNGFWSGMLGGGSW
ncbi:hypothetical protein M8C21_000651 [Ambrosia artemisiifolia]|uniref:Dof zinc finger protein n=1 Tax=Ambrosia artemisiifolia TaxID=4212 RepID=A0AAD5GI67_AMBAR|nr:hypothetical protein M8C21_000651 [Ambrosia artemisiifolia]